MKREPPRLPDREETHDGLAYAIWLPDAMGAEGESKRGTPSRTVPPPPWPGIVIVHGAGSRKENHADFAQLATASGWAALSFDLPGHGQSEGEMSGDAVDAVIAMTHMLSAHSGVDPRRVAVRGSSLGGFLAITAASAAPEIAGVIAICPANEDHLARGVRRGELEMRIGDPFDLEAWLTAQDIRSSVAEISPRPLMLMHAEGDAQISSDDTVELHDLAGEPKKLVIPPGGSHRTVQHDAELQAVGLRWLERQMTPG